MDKFQTKGLIILVVIILGAEVFVTIAWGVLLEEAGKVFQVFLLVPFEVAAHNDNAPVGDATNTTTVFPETDVLIHFAYMDGNTNAVGVVHNGTAGSVTESLTQIEIKIVNKIGIVHNNLNFDG